MELLWTVVLSVFHLVYVQAQTGVGKKFVIEAERLSKLTRFRTRASRFNTVPLKERDVLEFSFCLPYTTKVTLGAITYSNHGQADKGLIEINSRHLGHFETLKKLPSELEPGPFWNDFENTGPIGHAFYLPAGKHTLTITVLRSDSIGFELDKIVFLLPEAAFDHQSFICELYCMHNVPLDFVKGRRLSNIPSGRIEQRSSLTNCAEEDNIRVDVYHATTKSYKVVATAPRYSTSLNHRSPDFTDCSFTNNLIWEIGRHDDSAQELDTKNTWSSGKVFDPDSFPAVQFPAVINGSGKTGGDVEIQFRTDGPIKGLVEAVKGSILTVGLTSIRAPITLRMRFRFTNSSYSSPESRTFSNDKKVKTWSIPDLTWSEIDINKIHLEFIKESARQTAQVDFIRLEQRNERGETTSHVYSDGKVIIETVDIDFWWLTPSSMTLKVKNGALKSNVDYFRVYIKVPHNDDWAQIFVLYQDGNARILTLPAPGFDWIPFGSSVIIGQTDPSAIRPFSPIKHVDIDPDTLGIVLQYSDGSRATLQLSGSVLRTEVTVSNLNLVKDRFLYPIASFRSMWVTDGNSDVDHVTADGYTSYHITGDWKTLFGTSFIFYRTCVSRHNTLSPDIAIEFLSDS